MNLAPAERLRLGKLLSDLANGSAETSALQQASSVVSAKRIGVTGAPGAGKSTLVGRLAIRRKSQERIAILAIDPTSPRTGGAILGDRVRMDELEGVEDIYIRSIASRTASDGLCDSLPEMLNSLESFGFSEIVVETVGMGQVGFAVRDQVDTLVLVIQPDTGDFIQAMKAGIMELADIYVVNKSDLPGAQRLATEVERVLKLQPSAADAWNPPVIQASRDDSRAIGTLSEQITRHQAWLAGCGQAASIRAARSRYTLKRIIERYVDKNLRVVDMSFYDKSVQEQLERTLAMLSDSIHARK